MKSLTYILLFAFALAASAEPPRLRTVSFYVPASTTQSLAATYGGHPVTAMTVNQLSSRNIVVIVNAQKHDHAVLAEFLAAARGGLDLTASRIYFTGKIPGSLYALTQLGEVFALPSFDTRHAYWQRGGIWAGSAPEDEECLRMIAREYVNRGPVDVYWIDSYFSWLDGSGREDSFVSVLTEQDWQLMAESGLTLTQIVASSENRNTRVIAKSTHTSRFFGVSAYYSGETPGEALLQAIRDRSSTVKVTLQIPKQRMTWRGLPPTLKIVDKATGQIVMQRPASLAATPLVPYPSRLPRLVPLVTAREAVVNDAACGTAEPNRQQIGLRGVAPLSGDHLPAFLFLTASNLNPDEAEIGWIQRDVKVPLFRSSETICVGPITLHTKQRIMLTPPDASWLMPLEITPPATSDRKN